MAIFAKKIDSPRESGGSNPPARTIFHQNSIFPRKKDVFLRQMAGKTGKTEFLKMAERLAAVLSKSALTHCEKKLALKTALAIVKVRQSDGGAQ